MDEEKDVGVRKITIDDWNAARAQAAAAQTVKNLPSSEYSQRPQPPMAIEAVNQFKYLEEKTLRMIDGLLSPGCITDVDPRLLMIGKTQLQGAFMFLARAVFQPERVQLPEDRSAGANAHDIGPDTDNGPNPHYDPNA